MATATLYPRVTAPRRIQSLDGVWDFQFDPEGVGVAEGWHERARGHAGARTRVRSGVCAS